MRLTLPILLVACAAASAADAASPCSPRLAHIREAVGDLPHDTDYRVHDDLAEEFDLALEQEDANPAGCLAHVEKMEAVLRRNGVGTPPAAAASAPPKRPPVVRAGAARDVSAIDSFIAATRATQTQMTSFFAGAGMSPPAAAQQFQAEAQSSIALAEDLRNQIVVIEPEVIVNDLMDQLHAQLEDAFMAMEEAALRAERYFAQTEDIVAQGGSNADFKRAFESHLTAWKQRNQALAEVNRLRDRLALEMDSGDYSHRLPGYKEAFLALERKHRAEIRPIDDKCDEMGEQAQIKTGADFLNGDRASTALFEAGKRCDALRKPVVERHERELADLERRYSRKVPQQATRPERITPISAPPPPSAPPGVDDLLTPLVPAKAPSSASASTADDLLTPLVPPKAPPAESGVDDLLTPLVPPKAQPSSPAAVDDLLTPLTPAKRN